MAFWDALQSLEWHALLILLTALFVAFAFEFINGFHDTANAVATVIYTHALPAPVAVVYSGALNFLGVVLGGTAVAFSVVHLLPVELLIDTTSRKAIAIVLSLMLSGVVWNLGTWYHGLPVSSSHTLVGSILGVGLANSLSEGRGAAGVDWGKAGEVGLALLVSPVLGFVLAGGLLLLLKRLVPDPELFTPPKDQAPPPRWIRATLIATCGGVSFAHGSNDGQKGMGLVLLVLLGFLPTHYALNTHRPQHLAAARGAVTRLQALVPADQAGDARAGLDRLAQRLAAHDDFRSVPPEDRWPLRQSIVTVNEQLKGVAVPAEKQAEFRAARRHLIDAVEFVPTWVVAATALALGLGTTVGYKRIMVTVAEKIGKTHLTYGQGAAAEVVAAVTILAAVTVALPVSTTHVVASGIAGTMAANGSGVQGSTVRKIALAWIATLPGTMLLAGGMFTVARFLFV